MISDLRGAVWRKSSRSGSTGGSCVEMTFVAHLGAVRDSKNAGGPALTFPAERLARFVSNARDGQHGNP